MSNKTNKPANLPFNAMPIYDDSGLRDDTGKRVEVNSIGGPTHPDDKWGQALKNHKGTVVYGPVTFWYNAQAKVEFAKPRPDQKPQLRARKFTTDPYWCVLLDGLNLEIKFIEKELTFVRK
jgi:hypothetical protein